MKKRSTDADCQSLKSIVKPAGVAAIMRAKNCRAFNPASDGSIVGSDGAARLATGAEATGAAATGAAATEAAATGAAATEAAATEAAATEAAATGAAATGAAATGAAASATLCVAFTAASAAFTGVAALGDSAGILVRTAAGPTGVGGNANGAVAA